MSTELCSKLSRVINDEYIKCLDNISDNTLAELIEDKQIEFLENLSITQLQRLLHIDNIHCINEGFKPFDINLTYDLENKAQLIKNSKIIDYIIKYSADNLGVTESKMIMNTYTMIP